MSAVLRASERLGARAPLACGSCGSSWLAAEPIPCPLCGTGELASADVLCTGEPEVVVRFGIDVAEAGRRLEAHVRAARMPVPDALEAADRLVAHYVPAWLVDARLAASFQAEVGFDYEVQSTVERCSGGKWTSEAVTELRARWEPVVGTLQCVLENEAAPALRSWNGWLEVLRVPTPIVGGSLKDDRPVLLPDRPPDVAWTEAARGFRRRAGEVVRDAAGAQHVREVYLQPTWDDVHWTWVLFPVYSASYTDAAGTTRVLRVDGRTGAVHGPVGSDPRKGWLWAGVWFAAGLVVLAISALSVLPALLFPLILFLTFVGGVAGFLLLCAALVPVFQVWSANRALPTNDPCQVHVEAA